MSDYPTNKAKDWQSAREKARELAQHKAVDKCFEMIAAVPDPVPPDSIICEEHDYRVSKFFFGTKQCRVCGNCIEHLA